MRTQCGAKTRSGAPCKAPAGKNGRCKMHGKDSPGVPDNQNSVKHGIYGRTVREHEREIHAEMRRSVGSVDDELSLVRLQLHRTLEAQNAAAENAHNGLELQKYHDREATEFTAGDEHVYERVDYGAHIDRLTARIGSLEKLRAELLELNGGSGADDGLTRTDTFIAPDEPIPDKPIL
jgi:hypothetical protein